MWNKEQVDKINALMVQVANASATNIFRVRDAFSRVLCAPTGDVEETARKLRELVDRIQKEAEEILHQIEQTERDRENLIKMITNPTKHSRRNGYLLVNNDNIKRFRKMKAFCQKRMNGRRCDRNVSNAVKNI